MARVTTASVAASGEWIGPDGIRQPGGEVHAWLPGHNQTLCGIPLARSELRRFAHVPFDFRATDTVTDADEVRWICARCLAATRDGPRRSRVFRRP